MRINNKGFTLVELLAVMVILISISLVAVVTVTESLTRREEKELNEQIELAKGAAKIYFSLNGNSCVEISELISGNYFSETHKIDELNSSWTVKLVNNEYVYSSTEC